MEVDRVNDSLLILGLEAGASHREIDNAYRRLVQIYHPDRYSGAPEAVRMEAHRLMSQVNEARRMLKSQSRHLQSFGTQAGRIPPTLASVNCLVWHHELNAPGWHLSDGRGNALGSLQHDGASETNGFTCDRYSVYDATGAKLLELMRPRWRMNLTVKVVDPVRGRVFGHLIKKVRGEHVLEDMHGRQLGKMIEHPSGAQLLFDPAGKLAARVLGNQSNGRGRYVMHISAHVGTELRALLLAIPIGLQASSPKAA